MERVGRVGHNCWAIAKADRLAFLVDARSYFERLASALELARHSIQIVGWEIHSAVRLRRDGDEPAELAAILERAVERRPRLQVRILIWDCNVFCTVAREKLQTLKLGWQTSPRIEFRLDGEHPAAACHHEKIVVIDDSLAFLGGIDLTAHRWDTRDHAENHDERVDPSGEPYPAYHDLQVAVSGDAARELGRIVQQRWARAGGEPLDARSEPAPDTLPGATAVPRNAPSLWPPGLEPALEQVEVGLSRTDSTVEDRPEVRQIEKLYSDALGQAQRSVFIENQYLSSDAIRELLEGLLKREQGPEVCIVLAQRVSGWLEDTVMGRLRARVIRRLREADRWNRLHIWYPDRPAAEGPIIVHSKLCIVDNRFLTIGSANLSNRSMGLDTECNMFLEAAGSSRVQGAIVGLRDRLLAEHLGQPTATVSAAVRSHGSLHRAVEVLRGNRRTLVPLEVDSPESSAVLVGAEEVLDPERPLAWSDLIRRFFRA